MSALRLTVVLAVLVSRSVGAALPAEASECARSYVSEHVRFDSVSERNLALSQFGLREPSWAESAGLFPGDRFFYFSTSFSSQTFGLVVVDQDCKVMNLGDKSHVEEFLGSRQLHIDDAEEATALATMILRLCHVSAVFGQSYSEGVNIISTLDEVAFTSEDEQQRISALLRVVPPKMELHEDGFTYRFFSWNKLGNGNIYENVLHLDRARHITKSKVLLSSKVGDWRGLR